MILRRKKTANLSESSYFIRSTDPLSGYPGVDDLTDWVSGLVEPLCPHDKDGCLYKPYKLVSQ